MHNDTLTSQFHLRRDITYLNFGSFGACAKPIFERYQQFQMELEQEPVQFITVNGPKYLQQSREALAAYIGCNGDDVVFVTNPSYGVNIIAKSLKLQPGDEVLTTNIEYGACDKAWQYYCDKAGAKYVRQNIHFPLTTKEDFSEQFFAGLTDNTKLVFISHITSATGLRLPVEEICSIAKSKGLMTFVDGAHAPGQIKIDLTTLGADIYTGACHKWMMAPKGCSFLYVKKELQSLFDPLIISWGYQSAFPSQSVFLDYHQMQGTRDFSAFLTIPAAIDFMKKYDWENIASGCRKMVLVNAEKFCKLLHSQPLTPINEDFLVQMFSIPIMANEPEKLQRHLFEKYNIEIPVMKQDDKVYIRFSIQAFNTQKDLDILYNALMDILENTSLIEE